MYPSIQTHPEPNYQTIFSWAAETNDMVTSLSTISIHTFWHTASRAQGYRCWLKRVCKKSSEWILALHMFIYCFQVQSWSNPYEFHQTYRALQGHLDVIHRDSPLHQATYFMSMWVTDKIWYMAKGHPKVGWAPIGFAVAAPCTNLPEGIVLGIVLGWAPIGFAAMATPRPSQYYFGHT